MKLLNSLRSHPVVSGIAAVFIAVAGVAGAVNAWGPSRTTFTMEHPASYPVFNSITNNPTYGDERNFVTVKDVTANGQFQSSVDLVEGHTYKVQIYIHNDASDTLNASGKGIARGTTVTAFMPSTVDGSAQAQATVAASNTNPTKVWDDAVLKSSRKVNLEYVSGSALLSHNTNGANNDVQVKLSDSLLSSGVKVGSYGLDGSWYACHGYAGAVTFEFKVQETPKGDFTMDKQVRKHSTTTGGWTDNYVAQPGETVDYIIRYKNTGNITQDNVVVKDVLPAGMEYVAGSTVLANANNPNGKTINDDVTTKGVNIGSYTPGSNAWVRFSAKVASKESLVCGTNTLKNVATVTTGSGSKSDDAIVTTSKECQEEKQPVYKCDLLTIDKVSSDSYKFSVKYTAADGATYKSTTYKVYDSQGKEVYNSSNGSFSGFTAGTYTVKAYVTVTVNGSDKTVTSESCAQSFTIEQEKKPAIKIEKLVDGVDTKTVAVNQEFNYQIKVTNTGNVDLKDAVVTDKQPSGVEFISADAGTIKSGVWTTTISTLKVGESKSFVIKAKVPEYKSGTIKNTVCVDTPTIPGSPDDCDDANVNVPPKTETEKVCKIDTKEIVTINTSDFDSSKYSKNLDDCSETPTPTQEKVCNTTTKEIITINTSDFDSSKYSRTLSDCQTTPSTTVTELPKTGTEAGVFSVLGAGSLGYAIYAYAVSRRINR